MRDRDIRSVLRNRTNALHEGESDTLILNELALCQGSARVDLAVVNGQLCGYEIKSAHDTLGRLPHQVEVYSKVLDKVTLVASRQHVDKVKSIIPDWWGIDEALEVDGCIALAEVRPASQNPSIDPYSLVQLLWRDEALEALRVRGISRGVENKPRRAIWERLVEVLTQEELGHLVRSQLKHRQGWRVDEQPQ